MLKGKTKRIAWRDVQIQGARSQYRVSNDGNVVDRFTGKALIQYTNADGSLSVRLEHNGKTYKMRVHQLVARAFIPNPSKWICVLHKDGDKSHNCHTNLEWDSSRAWA